MEEENEQKNKLSELFGVDKETLDKSKNILPVLDLGKMEIGTKVKVEFLEDAPREIKTPNNQYGNETAKVINVKEISLGEGEDEGAVKYSLFLSSKSLALGVARVYVENKESLLGTKVLITISETVYKTFGLNRCYIVQQLTAK